MRLESREEFSLQVKRQIVVAKEISKLSYDSTDSLLLVDSIVCEQLNYVKQQLCIQFTCLSIHVTK